MCDARSRATMPACPCPICQVPIQSKHTSTIFCTNGSLTIENGMFFGINIFLQCQSRFRLKWELSIYNLFLNFLMIVNKGI